MLALPGLDLRQAHPLSLAQQVLSRLPANDMGFVRFVLVMVSMNVKAVTLIAVRVICQQFGISQPLEITHSGIFQPVEISHSSTFQHVEISHVQNLSQ